MSTDRRSQMSALGQRRTSWLRDEQRAGSPRGARHQAEASGTGLARTHDKGCPLAFTVAVREPCMVARNDSSQDPASPIILLDSDLCASR